MDNINGKLKSCFELETFGKVKGVCWKFVLGLGWGAARLMWSYLLFSSPWLSADHKARAWDTGRIRTSKDSQNEGKPGCKGGRGQRAAKQQGHLGKSHSEYSVLHFSWLIVNPTCKCQSICYLLLGSHHSRLEIVKCQWFFGNSTDFVLLCVMDWVQQIPERRWDAEAGLKGQEMC